MVFPGDLTVISLENTDLIDHRSDHRMDQTME
jgi:hypothetical protein